MGGKEKMIQRKLLRDYVREVYEGKWDNDTLREQLLGIRYARVQNAVNYVAYNYPNDIEKGIEKIDPELTVILIDNEEEQ